ncbi:Kynurenine formamidase, partial [Rhizopus stolonifer]
SILLLIQFRLSLKEHPDAIPQVQHPDHIMDVGKAIEYLYNTSEGHYNPHQIYIVGHSAGAHIALMLLLDTVYHQYIAGVIGVSGIYDIPLLLKTFPSYTDFIVQAFGADQSRFLDASPISKTSTQLGHKPIIIAHSPQDMLIDHQQPECMVAHLQQFHPNVVLDMTLKGDHYEIMKTETLEQVVKQIIQK